MASAYPEFDDISEKSETVVDGEEPCVESKDKTKKINHTNEVKSEVSRDKAYIPGTLPKDFLRVMLNEHQVNETTDEELARRLQYAIPRQSRPHANNQVNFRGRLQIEILEAQLNKNYGIVKMDPYVKLTIASKVYETPTDYSGAKHPKWFKTIMCYIPFSVDMIKFEIFDEKSFTEDELIAVVNFPLADALFKNGSCEEWLPLSGKLGEQKEGSISIRINFLSIDKIQQSHSNSPYEHEIPGLYSRPPYRPNLPVGPQQNIQLAQDLNLDDDLNTALRLSTAESASMTSYSEEDLKNIHEMFPSFDLDVIKSILDASKGNKEATIESLLQMAG